MSLLLSLTSSAFAEGNQEQTPAFRGNSEFRALYNPVISADGAWMAAEERANSGMVNVRVWSTKSDVTFTIERGHNPRISRDSRWVSALQTPPRVNLRTARRQRAGQTLVLVNLQDGSRRTFDFVLSYEVTYFSSHVVYLQSPETKTDQEMPSNDTAKAAPGHQTGTLRVVELVGDRVFTWRNVTQYAAHQKINFGAGEEWNEGYAYVALVIHNEETGRDRLEVAFVGHAKRGRGSGGIYEGEKIEGLCWARDSVTLGFLDSAKPQGNDGKPVVSSALYVWHHVRERSGFREFKRVDAPK